MEKFPNINKDQIAVLFIDRNTGHVLDIDFKISISDGQIVMLKISDNDIKKWSSNFTKLIRQRRFKQQ